VQILQIVENGQCNLNMFVGWIAMQELEWGSARPRKGRTTTNLQCKCSGTNERARPAWGRCSKPRLGNFVPGTATRDETSKKKENYRYNRPWTPIGLWDVEAPTFSLYNRLTDGGKVFSLTRRQPFTPQESSWYSFLLEAESTPGP
jgi:hypothetical protein